MLSLVPKVFVVVAIYSACVCITGCGAGGDKSDICQEASRGPSLCLCDGKPLEWKHICTNGKQTYVSGLPGEPIVKTITIARLLQICDDAGFYVTCKKVSNAVAKEHQKISTVKDVIFAKVAAAVQTAFDDPEPKVGVKRSRYSEGGRRFVQEPLVIALRRVAEFRAVVDDVVFGEGEWIKEFGVQGTPSSRLVASEFRYREYLGQREGYAWRLSRADDLTIPSVPARVDFQGKSRFDPRSYAEIHGPAYVDVGIDLGPKEGENLAAPWTLISVSCERAPWPVVPKNSWALNRNVEDWRNKDHFGRWMIQTRLSDFVPRNFTPELQHSGPDDDGSNGWRSFDIVGAVERKLNGFDGNLVIKPQLGGGSAKVEMCASSDMDCWKDAIREIQKKDDNQDWGGVRVEEAIKGKTAFGTFYVAHEGELLDAFTMEYFYGEDAGDFPKLPPGGNLRKAGGAIFWATQANEDIKDLLRKILKTEKGKKWAGIGDVEWKYRPGSSPADVVPVIFDWNPRIGAGATMEKMLPFFLRKLVNAHQAARERSDMLQGQQEEGKHVGVQNFMKSGAGRIEREVKREWEVKRSNGSWTRVETVDDDGDTIRVQWSENHRTLAKTLPKKLRKAYLRQARAA